MNLELSVYHHRCDTGTRSAKLNSHGEHAQYEIHNIEHAQYRKASQQILNNSNNKHTHTKLDKHPIAKANNTVRLTIQDFMS